MNFTSKFPRAKDYSKLSSIHEAFPHLKEVNDPNFNIESISSDAHFYILRSSNDDNIHKVKRKISMVYSTRPSSIKPGQVLPVEKIYSERLGMSSLNKAKPLKSTYFSGFLLIF